MIYYCTLAVGVFAVIVFLALRVSKGGLNAMFAKAAASVLFVLSALAALIYGMQGDISFKFRGIYGVLITAGLIFGILGDVFLDLKIVYKESNKKDSEAYTYSGFASFGAGHFFFIAAITYYSAYYKTSNLNKAVLFSVLVSIVAALVIYFGAKPMKLDYGKFKLVSAIYGFILFYMTAYAAFSYFFATSGGSMKPLLVLSIGGVLFIISDLILSQTYFGGKDKPAYVVMNHIAYYAAQFLIAFSVLSTLPLPEIKF
ncbi:MAG: lysoplasmalogenase [Oscillospiraceae bacterium]|nr:lysoplasmalogenase [Oscillospiraceae bacterium]